MGKRLIFERAIKLDPTTGDLKSYWPDRWPLERLLDELQSMGSPFFSAAYMNDTSGLEGNVLKIQWLGMYLPNDLETARQNAQRSAKAVTRHSGIDPAEGGEGDNPDFCGCIGGEKIENRLFLTNILSGRWRVDDQATRIEGWLDVFNPDFTIIEDKTSKGYVYVAMSTQINSGEGSRHAFRIEKPTGPAAGGNKITRFLSMAPRFENRQVLIPGIQVKDEIQPHPDWIPFVQQWIGFPSGHDDMLDAAYWCVWSAYGNQKAYGFAKSPTGAVRGMNQRPGVVIELCVNGAHVNRGRPISQCPRCMMNKQDRQEFTRRDDIIDDILTLHSRRQSAARIGQETVRRSTLW